MNTATRLSIEANNILHKMRIFKGGRTYWIRWLPPEEEWVKLNTDGTRKETTRLGSAGRDHRGVWIKGFTVKIGATDNFLVELWSLREGLRLTREWGIRESDRRDG